MENVGDIVNSMLYGKTSQSGSEGGECDGVGEEFLAGCSIKEVQEVKSPVTPNLAPFPYKVAKALDPEIYRNIAYDTWTEMRRGKNLIKILRAGFYL